MYVRVFAAVWLLACTGLALLAWGFEAPFAYDPVGPRAYPLLLLLLMACGAAWLLFKPHGEPTPAFDRAKAQRAVLCVLALLAYALLFETLGFVISTALAGFALGLLFNGRLWPSVISGALLGVLLYGLFDYLLDVPLPLGCCVCWRAEMETLNFLMQGFDVATRPTNCLWRCSAPSSAPWSACCRASAR